MAAQILSPPAKPISEFIRKPTSPSLLSLSLSFSPKNNRRRPFKLVVKSVTEERELVTTQTSTSSNFEIQEEEDRAGIGIGSEEIDNNAFVGRTINATVILCVGTLAVTKLLTIDHGYWHGWTLDEILRYVPEHNWIAYEEALKENPILAKMAIIGVVYSVGDWIAQCYEGKPIFEFGRTRLFRSGLVGFALHGRLSHYYYQVCEALIPSKDWLVVPAKITFDQTAWAALWNSIYFVVLGLLRLESPANILDELKATFWPMLTAGWKLWPFAHLVTYRLIPVEQRLLWVDCVELIWVTILSTYSNEKSETRMSETSEANSGSLSKNVSKDQFSKLLES